MVGTIKLYIGCMYSGKTSELIKECKKHLAIEKKVMCINYKNDTRYGDDDFLYSHDLHKIECVKVDKLADVSDNLIKNIDSIMINEGQFFTDLYHHVKKWCEEYNKDIIISGLDGDFKRQRFGTLLDVIPLADSVHKLSALCSICKNGTLANFSHRLSNEHEQVVIGATNYIAVCRKHYLELNKDQHI